MTATIVAGHIPRPLTDSEIAASMRKRQMLTRETAIAKAQLEAEKNAQRYIGCKINLIEDAERLAPQDPVLRCAYLRRLHEITGLNPKSPYEFSEHDIKMWPYTGQ